MNYESNVDCFTNKIVSVEFSFTSQILFRSGNGAQDIIYH